VKAVFLTERNLQFMKKLILVLFAIVTFSFGINAQNLRFNTFNQTIEPKGDLVSTVSFYGKVFYNYHEWNKYGITVTEFLYSPENKKVESVTKQSIFFDELDFDKMTFGESNAEKFVLIFKTKGGKISSLRVDYETDKYTKSPRDVIVFTLKNKTEADELISKLKDKAFDMELDLDAEVERVNLKNELRYFTADYPDGIGYDDYRAATQSKSPSQTKSEDSEAESSVSFISVTLKHTGGERYYLLINGVDNEKCQNAVFSFTHSKYGEETRNYTFCEGQKLIEKNTGRIIFTATKAMDGTTYKIN